MRARLLKLLKMYHGMASKKSCIVCALNFSFLNRISALLGSTCIFSEEKMQKVDYYIYTMVSYFAHCVVDWQKKLIFHFMETSSSFSKLKKCTPAV